MRPGKERPRPAAFVLTATSGDEPRGHAGRDGASGEMGRGTRLCGAAAEVCVYSRTEADLCCRISAIAHALLEPRAKPPRLVINDRR